MTLTAATTGFVTTEVSEAWVDARLALALLEVAPDAIVVADEHGTILLANAQTELLSGYLREELVGQPVQTLLPGGRRELGVAHVGQDVSPKPGRSGAMARKPAPASHSRCSLHIERSPTPA